MNTENFIDWDNLPAKDRAFFVGEEYLPFHDNIASRISLLKGPEARKLSKELLVNSASSASQKNSCEKSVKTDNAWNDKVGTGEIRAWLFDLAIPFSREVFLIYDHSKVVKTEWKIFVKYWDAFSWSVGMALLIVDQTKQWLLEILIQPHSNRQPDLGGFVKINRTHIA